MLTSDRSEFKKEEKRDSRRMREKLCSGKNGQ